MAFPDYETAAFPYVLFISKCLRMLGQAVSALKMGECPNFFAIPATFLRSLC
jgi:hypothetical protein